MDPHRSVGLVEIGFFRTFAVYETNTTKEDSERNCQDGIGKVGRLCLSIRYLRLG